VTHLSVLPAHTTYIMTFMTHTFFNTFDSRNVNLSHLQHFCVWKDVFWVDETPGKFDPKFQQTRSPMRYNIWDFFLQLTPQNFSLRRPRGANRPISVFYFCFLFRKRHHCGNKLFPVSVSLILTETPITGYHPSEPVCGPFEIHDWTASHVGSIT